MLTGLEISPRQLSSNSKLARSPGCIFKNKLLSEYPNPDALPLRRLCGRLAFKVRLNLLKGLPFCFRKKEGRDDEVHHREA